MYNATVCRTQAEKETVGYVQVAAPSVVTCVLADSSNFTSAPDEDKTVFEEQTLGKHQT